MSAKRICDGHLIDYTPAAAKTAGDVVVVGDLVGVVTTDLAAGELGALDVSGVYEFPKATGGGSSIACGASLFYKAADGTADDLATVGKRLGSAVPGAGGDPTTAADDDAEVVRVKLGPSLKQAAVVAALGQTISGSYTQSEVQAISTKVDALLTALKNAGLMASA